jgi:hypothetical protein
MQASTAAWVAWSIGGLCVVGTIGGIMLGVLNGHSHLPDLAMAVALLSYPVVGALIAARRPDNLVGWVLCAVGVCFTLQLASDPYARYALVTAPGSLPGDLYFRPRPYWALPPSTLSTAGPATAPSSPTTLYRCCCRGPAAAGPAPPPARSAPTQA